MSKETVNGAPQKGVGPVKVFVGRAAGNSRGLHLNAHGVGFCASRRLEGEHLAASTSQLELYQKPLVKRFTVKFAWSEGRYDDQSAYGPVRLAATSIKDAMNEVQRILNMRGFGAPPASYRLTVA